MTEMRQTLKRKLLYYSDIILNCIFIWLCLPGLIPNWSPLLAASSIDSSGTYENDGDSVYNRQVTKLRCGIEKTTGSPKDSL